MTRVALSRHALGGVDRPGGLEDMNDNIPSSPRV